MNIEKRSRKRLRFLLFVLFLLLQEKIPKEADERAARSLCGLMSRFVNARRLLPPHVICRVRSKCTAEPPQRMEHQAGTRAVASAERKGFVLR